MHFSALPPAPAAHEALQKSKQRQALYYDRTARERPTLPVGQTVRIKFNDDTWRKGEIVKILPHRSYRVRLEDGTTHGGEHLDTCVFSSESPLITDTDEIDCDVPAAASAGSTSGGQLNGHLSVSATDQPSANAKTTRSGRVVRLPARYRES
jgi:hypothetical protein